MTPILPKIVRQASRQVALKHPNNFADSFKDFTIFYKIRWVIFLDIS